MMPVPYPAETRAKGWRFELDLEQVETSTTWLLARTGAVRGALLLLWAKAWQQTPCGTLPDDDALIALLIDMPSATFARHKSVLLRGWTLAADGRLYHDTITARVLAMLDKRASDAQRAANRRARIAAAAVNHDCVTGASRVTTAGNRSEFDTKHQAPSTIENSPKPPRGGRAAVAFKTWAEELKAVGEPLIPEDDPVFAYAAEVGIPRELMDLAWSEFKHRYSQPDAKRYRDWRAVFRKAIRGNWLKLWCLDRDSYRLTTAGQQAQRARGAE